MNLKFVFIFLFLQASLLAGGCFSREVGTTVSEPDAQFTETAPVQNEQRPNILFIMSDDHALRAIGAYGDSLIETPNIDRIAKEGVLFENAFVTNSICSPSRATLLTGKFSHQNGLRDNRDVFDGSQVTFPKMLQRAGYETSVIGKWHLKSAPTGFDHWKILIGQGEYYSPQFKSEDGIVTYDGAYVTDKITDLAIGTLNSRDENKPFMMLYHHKAPHRNWMPNVDDLDTQSVKNYPRPPTFADNFENRPAARLADMQIADMFLSWDMKLQPKEYVTEDNTGGGRGRATAVSEAVEGWANAYNRMSQDQKVKWDAFYSVVNAEYDKVKDDPEALRNWKYQRYLHDYLATIQSLDENVGRILNYLDEHGLAENTIVVYTSDQGFYLGEHGWYDKRFMYEESMRAPLMVRFPQKVKAGQNIKELIQNIDYAPTFLDYASVQLPQDLPGISLRKLLEGDKKNFSRDELYYHYYEYPHGWHLVRPHYGIRTERYKLIHFYGDADYWELYDLGQDPLELKNVYGWPENIVIQADLHKRLVNLKKRLGDE